MDDEIISKKMEKIRRKQLLQIVFGQRHNEEKIQWLGRYILWVQARVMRSTYCYGKELLEQADLVIYAGYLVNPEVLNYSKGEKVTATD
jgi:hypothetical protein